MKIEKSSILVTGAAGFIGSHLTEQLTKMDANVRAFVRYNSSGYIGNLRYMDSFPDNLEIVFGDLRDPYATRKAMKDIDYVFNLASLVSIPYSYANPRDYFDNNINILMNILEASNDLGVQAVVHTSTSEVYGTAEIVPIPESHPLKGQSPYSASKIGADMLALSFYRSFDTPVSIVRPFNAFGPRQSERAVLPTIITQALSGDVVLLGDVRPTRDFNYVTDTAEGILATAVAGKKAFGEVFNIGSGIEVTIKEVAEQIIEIAASESRIVFDATRIRPSKSEVHRLCADASKARKILGWESKVSLKEGLTKTIEWYREFHSKYTNTKGYM